MPCNSCASEARCDNTGICQDFAVRMYRERAQALVCAARRDGLVITIEQRPLKPLAMGHHETTVAIRPARKPAC